MSEPHIIPDHIEIDGVRYALLDASPEQVLRWLHKHYRAEAFAAIRRAAEVARGLDRAATVRDFLSDYQMDCRAEAAAIRRAIRAAIGSEKA